MAGNCRRDFDRAGKSQLLGFALPLAQTFCPEFSGCSPGIRLQSGPARFAPNQLHVFRLAKALKALSSWRLFLPYGQIAFLGRNWGMSQFFSTRRAKSHPGHLDRGQVLAAITNSKTPAATSTTRRAGWFGEISRGKLVNQSQLGGQTWPKSGQRSLLRSSQPNTCSTQLKLDG